MIQSHVREGWPILALLFSEEHKEAAGPEGDTKPNSALHPPEAHSHREARNTAENTLLSIPQEKTKPGMKTKNKWSLSNLLASKSSYTQPSEDAHLIPHTGWSLWRVATYHCYHWLHPDELVTVCVLQVQVKTPTSGCQHISARPNKAKSLTRLPPSPPALRNIIIAESRTELGTVGNKFSLSISPVSFMEEGHCSRDGSAAVQGRGLLHAPGATFIIQVRRWVANKAGRSGMRKAD